MDLMLLALAFLVAVGYKMIVKNKKSSGPLKTEGPSDHLAMPETEFVFPLEPNEVNAQCFSVPGKKAIIGSFTTW